MKSRRERLQEEEGNEKEEELKRQKTDEEQRRRRRRRQRQQQQEERTSDDAETARRLFSDSKRRTNAAAVVAALRLDKTRGQYTVTMNRVPPVATDGRTFPAEEPVVFRLGRVPRGRGESSSSCTSDSSYGVEFLRPGDEDAITRPERRDGSTAYDHADFGQDAFAAAAAAAVGKNKRVAAAADAVKSKTVDRRSSPPATAARVPPLRR